MVIWFMIFDTNNFSFITFIALFEIPIGYLYLEFIWVVLQNPIFFLFQM